jgi:hypothetical protein
VNAENERERLKQTAEQVKDAIAQGFDSSPRRGTRTEPRVLTLGLITQGCALKVALDRDLSAPRPFRMRAEHPRPPQIRDVHTNEAPDLP